MNLSELDPFTIMFIVAIAIVVIMMVILSIVSYFFPNSRITKILKKVGEWIQDGIQGL